MAQILNTGVHTSWDFLSEATRSQKATPCHSAQAKLGPVVVSSNYLVGGLEIFKSCPDMVLGNPL